MGQQVSSLAEQGQALWSGKSAVLPFLSAGMKVNPLQKAPKKRRNVVKDALAAWWALPPPGRVDEHNREAAALTPDTFQGFRCEFNRYLQTLPVTAAERRAYEAGLLRLDRAPRLLVTHQSTLMRAPTMTFGGYRNPQSITPENVEDQQFTVQYSNGPLTMLGRIGGSKSLFSSVALAFPRARLTVQGELPPDERRRAAYGAEAVCCIGPSTTHLRARSSDRILMVGHMQALTRRLAVGAEYLRTPDDSALQFALRAVVRGGNAVIAALGSPRPRSLAVSYTQRVTPRLRCCAGVDIQPVAVEPGNGGDDDADTDGKRIRMSTAAVVGYEYSSSDEDVIVRGQIDTRGVFSTTFEEALDEAIRISASAVINPFQHSYVWGLGFSCTS